MMCYLHQGPRWPNRDALQQKEADASRENLALGCQGTGLYHLKAGSKSFI